MKDNESISGYSYGNASIGGHHAYLLPTVQSLVSQHFSSRTGIPRRLFDVGCGNGSVAVHFAKLGYDVAGVDPSATGIKQANEAYPTHRFEMGSAYDPLAEKYGQWPAVISLEVVEHVYAPREYAKTLFELVEPGGLAIVSTPYHGYLKNIAIALSGNTDKHFTALWDHGHIKFWSINTLSQLLTEAGFDIDKVERVGRFRPLAKSMILAALRPKQ